MRIQGIIKLYKQGNVSVSGLRGTGKDMLTANVIARRKMPYISNMDYKVRKSLWIPLQMQRLNIENTYKNIVDGEIVPYEYPYPENCDIYLSDAGVYFPSQYTGQLDKQYSEFPLFQALSRHLGDCNFHFNTQNLGRVWNKIREQSDIYIRCIWCKVIGKLVFQKVIIYDKYEACESRVKPYKHVIAPIMVSPEARAQYLARDEILKREFEERNGKVKARILIYRNKSKYDTRYFKKLLGGEKT